MLKKLNLTVLLAAGLASASAFAAYGPSASAPAASSSAWTLGLGYGQMFGMKKTTTGNTIDARVDKPTVFEVDLFNSNGFGFVYMTSAKDKSILTGTNTVVLNKEYKFNAYLLGYNRSIANNMSARVLVGISDQEADATYKKDGEFAYGASVAYHMPLSGKMCGGLELGYLGQKKFKYDATNSPEVEASGFFAKVRMSTDI